jgi:glycosyltransferase involved in cell wall biosynthesis
MKEHLHKDASKNFEGKMSKDSKPTLSVVYITLNEGWRIRESLKSVMDDKDFATEVILLDTGSTDDTCSIAESMGAKIYKEEFKGFGKTKQSAIIKATSDWVISVDADEILTEKLRSEIKNTISKKSAKDGYEIKRVSWFLGKKIRYGGWGKDKVLRLFKNGKGRVTESTVHEKIIVEGSVGLLKNPMDHHTDPTFSWYFAKIDRYSTLSAIDIAKSDKATGLWPAIVHSTSKVFKKLILKSGWRDGIHGIILVASGGYENFMRYIKADMIRKGHSDRVIKHRLQQVEEKDNNV